MRRVERRGNGTAPENVIMPFTAHSTEEKKSDGLKLTLKDTGRHTLKRQSVGKVVKRIIWASLTCQQATEFKCVVLLWP